MPHTRNSEELKKHTQYNEKYNSNKTKLFGIRFIIGKDDDIISKLQSEPSVVNYLRRIIREDIEKEDKD